MLSQEGTYPQPPTDPLCGGKVGRLLLLLPNISVCSQGRHKGGGPGGIGWIQVCWVGRILCPSCWLSQKRLPAARRTASDLLVLCFAFKYLPVLALSSPPSFLSLVSHHPTIRWASFTSRHSLRNIKLGLSALALNVVVAVTPLHRLFCCARCLLG